MKRPDYYLLTVILVAFAFIAVNAYVIAKDKTPYVYDLGNLHSFSIDYFNYLQNGDYQGFYKFFRRDYFYPPFYILGALPIYLLFGTSQDASTLVNIPYIFMLFISVYYIGKKIGTSSIGLLSAILVALTPAVFSFSRIFLMDFAVCAAVSLSLCLMIYTEKFTKIRYNVLFGLSLGFGMMIKWTYSVFVIGPIALYLLYSFNLKDIISALTLKNKSFNFFLIAGIIGMALPIFWYYDKIDYILSRAARLNLDYSLQIGGFMPLTIQNFSWYIHALYYPLLRHFFALFILSFGYYIFFIKSKHKNILIAWFIVPYLIYTFTAWKDSRYLLGALPPLAVAAAIAIDYISKKMQKKSQYGLYLNAAFLIILSSSAFIFYDTGKTHPFSLSTLISSGLYTWHDTDYKIDEMLDAVKDDFRNKLLIVPSSQLLNSFANALSIKKPGVMQDRGLFCIGSGGTNNCRESKLIRFSNREYICDFDSVITYKEQFDHSSYGVIFLPNESVHHNETILPLLNNWEYCRKNFKVAYSFQDITNNNLTILFYQNIKTDFNEPYNEP